MAQLRILLGRALKVHSYRCYCLTQRRRQLARRVLRHASPRFQSAIEGEPVVPKNVRLRATEAGPLGPANGRGGYLRRG